jgi:hypothetical protein
VKYRYLDLILGAFGVTLVVSNVASTKVATLDLGGWRPVFDGGTFLFPLTYVFATCSPRSTATPGRGG